MDKGTKKFVITVVTLGVVVFIFSVLYYMNVIPHIKYTNDDFNIETYISKIDKDGDGIDDQTDILESVRAYIATKPKYKSKYYKTGYPDDSYGVCTDVVAFGLLGAGYDIQELLYNDVKAHKDCYDIEVIDKNIDFRRVKNLKVYLENNAISLTTDIRDIDEWQGGDIIVFPKHVGIISDKRNIKGVPFVIHNAGKFQFGYEQDILENSTMIEGHYRIS